MRWRWIGALALLLAVFSVAEARVGGGQGFSGGSSGSSSDGEIGLIIDVFILLIHLCIDYPKIGCPLLTVFVILVGLRFAYQAGMSARKVVENHSVSTAPAPRLTSGRDQLKNVDGAFSEVVFLDFAALVHRRALGARGDFSTLAPFVGPKLQEQLQPWKGVTEVIVGGVTLQKIAVGSPQKLTVDFIAILDGDRGKQLVQSRWMFQRAAGTLSLPPEAMLSLSCPNCGNTAETSTMGACMTCDTPITKGQLQWQAVSMQITSQGAAPRPQLGLNQGGVEGSANAPTIYQPQLAVHLRRLSGRHPDFERDAFKARVEHIYHSIQSAWSANTWDRARPFVSDLLYQQLRFWIDDYQRAGLRNQLTEVTLKKVQIVRIQDDAWYEAITVRIWGSMCDSVVDGQGKVVAGNASKPRVFSEYWTLLRAAGTGAATSDPASCPSCGAPADNVGSDGVCGYCDSKLSSGKFDWVLSRIEQAEAYRG